MQDDNKIGSNRPLNRGSAGKGRPLGAANKITRDLKSAILGALDALGGQAYLEQVAETDPRTFCALLGRVLPTTLAGDPDNPHRVQVESIAAEVMATIAGHGRFVPPAAVSGE